MNEWHRDPNNNDQRYYLDILNVLKEILTEVQGMRAALSALQVPVYEVKSKPLPGPAKPRKPKNVRNPAEKLGTRGRKLKSENKDVVEDVIDMESTAEGPYIS